MSTIAETGKLKIVESSAVLQAALVDYVCAGGELVCDEKLFEALKVFVLAGQTRKPRVMQCLGQSHCNDDFSKNK